MTSYGYGYTDDIAKMKVLSALQAKTKETKAVSKRYDRNGWACMFRATGRLWPLNRSVIYRTRSEARKSCRYLRNAKPVRVYVQVLP